MALEIKPAEGMIAVTFVDDDDDDTPAPSPPGSAPAIVESKPYEGCLAIVNAIGPKVVGPKVGATVLMRPWARDGVKFEGMTICSSYDYLGTITG